MGIRVWYAATLLQLAIPIGGLAVIMRHYAAETLEELQLQRCTDRRHHPRSCFADECDVA